MHHAMFEKLRDFAWSIGVAKMFISKSGDFGAEYVHLPASVLFRFATEHRGLGQETIAS